jgi:hypothetical protein
MHRVVATFAAIHKIKEHSPNDDGDVSVLLKTSWMSVGRTSASRRDQWAVSLGIAARRLGSAVRLAQLRQHCGLSKYFVRNSQKSSDWR